MPSDQAMPGVKMGSPQQLIQIPPSWSLIKISHAFCNVKDIESTVLSFPCCALLFKDNKKFGVNQIGFKYGRMLKSSLPTFIIIINYYYFKSHFKVKAR